MNNQAFIDGQNLKLGTFKTNPSWNVDLKRFRVYLSQKYNVNEAYYFIGAYDPKNQDLYSALQKFGYIVIFREHVESALSKKKGNVDTDIVFTVMKSLAEKEKFETQKLRIMEELAQQKEAYVVVSNNGTMITFYYDLQKANREGTVCQIEGTSPAWIGTLTKPNTQIITAEFDKSFQEYRPKRTWRWFFNCSALKEIKGMENLNTSETTEMVGMFSGCKALTSLNLSKFDTSMADNINNMFMECEALTSLDLSNFNTEKVTSMSYLFAGCKALESLNLSSFNTKNVRTMGDMFAGCANMTKIDVTFLNTESVSDMKGMFSGCSKLTSIDLSKFNTERVSRMNAMFKGCKSTIYI